MIIKNLSTLWKRIWKPKKRIQLICFDLDNTLYDYGVAEAEAETYIATLLQQKLSQQKSKEFNARKILDYFIEIKKSHMHHDSDPKMFSRKLWYSELLKKCDFKGNISLFSKKLEHDYWEHLVPKIRLFPETIHTLDMLKKKYVLACITDSDGEKKIKMDRIIALGLNKYFNYIITTDDTGKNKPAIDNWEYLLKLSGLRAEDCMMVGDHPDVDLMNPKRLGFITVWTKQHIHTDMHFRYVDHEIRDIKEMLTIIKNYSR